MRTNLKETLTCLRCGYKWRPRVAEVKQCPNCKSYLWNVPRKDGPRYGKPSVEDKVVTK